MKEEELVWECPAFFLQLHPFPLLFPLARAPLPDQSHEMLEFAPTSAKGGLKRKKTLILLFPTEEEKSPALSPWNLFFCFRLYLFAFENLNNDDAKTTTDMNNTRPPQFFFPEFF